MRNQSLAPRGSSRSLTILLVDPDDDRRMFGDPSTVIAAPTPGLEVRETHATSRDAGLPYREPGKKIGSGLSISWRVDRSNFRVQLTMLLVLVGGANVALWLQAYSRVLPAAPGMLIAMAILMLRGPTTRRRGCRAPQQRCSPR